MDGLPQELIDRISSHLDNDDLKSTLLVSPSFQFAAERQSGAFSTFELQPEAASAERFLSTYQNHRFQYLRHVHFRTSFPQMRVDWTEDCEDEIDDPGAVPPCRYSFEELHEKDQHFTSQIRSLFETLKALEEKIAVNSSNMRGFELTVFTPTQDIELGEFCWHQIYTSWRTHLLGPETLPDISLVRSLNIQNGAPVGMEDGYKQWPSVRKIDWRIILDLAGKLPRLERLVCRIGGDEWPCRLKCKIARHFMHDWEGPRRDSRRDFAKALEYLNIPSLRNIDLDFINPLNLAVSLDHRKKLPDLVFPALFDDFSSNLRICSSQLRRMNLRGVFDTNLFWPSEGDLATPTWPHLESLSVMFHVSTPSGGWYFEGLQNEKAPSKGFQITEAHYPPFSTKSKDKRMDRKVDHIQWEMYRQAVFRVVPNEDTLVPFLTAFAKAAVRMPSLKQAALWCPLQINANDVSSFYKGYHGEGLIDPPFYRPYSITTLDELAWGVAYTAPGEKNFNNGKDPLQMRELSWRTGNKWRPSSELRATFQQIGLERYGNDLFESFEHRYYNTGMVEQSVFSQRFEAVDLSG
jgi:hypothetical protein